VVDFFGFVNVIYGFQCWSCCVIGCSVWFMCCIYGWFRYGWSVFLMMLNGCVCRMVKV